MFSESRCTIRLVRLLKRRDCWHAFNWRLGYGNSHHFKVYKEHSIGHCDSIMKHKTMASSKKNSGRKTNMTNKDRRCVETHSGPKTQAIAIPENIRNLQSLSGHRFNQKYRLLVFSAHYSLFNIRLSYFHHLCLPPTALLLRRIICLSCMLSWWLIPCTLYTTKVLLFLSLML